MRSPRLYLLLLATLLLAGCSNYEVLPVEYGKRTGNSVNGTAVFSSLCENAGFDTQTRRTLGPELQRTADVIVWFPDDFAAPSPKHQRWFDKWLQSGGGRTLVVVGRDFEAQESYWAEVNARGLSNNKTLAASYLKNATIEVNGEYNAQPFPHDGGWYDKTSAAKQGKVTAFAGPWSRLFNPAAAQVETHSTLSETSTNPTTVMLSETAPNKSTPLVFVEQISANWNPQATSSSSQRITVANGSFLLNYPLVNKEHRKLAVLMIQQIDSITPGGEMVFIESGPGGPPIREHESLAKFSTGLEFFSMPPLGTFLTHLALLGILFCFVRWPIFGRPKEPPKQTGVDFGLHLGALASLLERTGDKNYARLRLEQYQRTVQKK
jgi:hypothetical protein